MGSARGINVCHYGGALVMVSEEARLLKDMPDTIETLLKYVVVHVVPTLEGEGS